MIDNIKKLDKNIYEVISVLEQQKELWKKAFYKSIYSFIKGNDNSNLYFDIFINYPLLFGSFPSASDADIKDSIERLKSKGLIVEKRSTRNKPYYETIVIKENKTFYESASKSEKEILDEFRILVKKILKGYVLEDKPHTYGFKSKNENINKKICWISRDNNRKLQVKFRKTEEDNEKTLPLTTKKEKQIAWRNLSFLYTNTVDNVKEIQERIKNKDQFDTYISNDFVEDVNCKLLPHQKAGAELANSYNKFAFFYDTGTGKTVMSLEIMSRKFRENGVRFLVIAPKPLIKSAWIDDKNEFYKKMKLLPLSKNITNEDYAKIYDNWLELDGKKRRFQYDENGDVVDVPKKKDVENEILPYLYRNAQHFIINMDLIKEPKKANELLNKIKVGGLIIDESSILKNYKSKNSTRARVIAKKMDYVYLLSGKPAPNNELEYYSQMCIVDPDTFNFSYHFFQEAYFKNNGRKWVFRNAWASKEVAKLIGNKSIIISKEDCIELPKTVNINVSVEMDEHARESYDQLAEDLITFIISNEDALYLVKVNSKISLLMKLREIACGFYLDNNDPIWLNHKKEEEILEIIKDIGISKETHKQVLIWCNFREEIESMKRTLEKNGYSVVTAYAKEKNIDESIKKFKNGDVEIMVAHPKTLQYGVSFVKCNYVIYNSLSYSLESYYQSYDRTHRYGQTQECIYYHMLTEDSIDEIIYKALKNKENENQFFERLIKHFCKHGIDKFKAEKALELLKKNIEINKESYRDLVRDDEGTSFNNVSV